MISWYASPDLVGQLLTFVHRRESGEDVRIVLCEGDSWFSFGGLTSNLLMAMDHPDTLLVSCAHPGDTLRNMASMGNEPLWMMLSPRFGVKWDAVYLSAGGNDLLADVGRLLNGDNLDRELLAIALDAIYMGYWRIVSTIREHHDCPIHAHTYDYPVSDPRGGWFRSGPWIGDRLEAAGIERHRHDGIIAALIDGLATTLHAMDGLTIHDTRGTLERGRWGMFGRQKHWANEIHASPLGYRLLASKWNQGK